MPPTYRCLTIAGSDPSGGAGIQGDLKTFAAHNQYGMAVITALTAQNTLGVQGVHQVPTAFVETQLSSVFDDLRPHAIKTGMLAKAEIVRAVAKFLSQNAPGKLVVDPVMVATSGARLLDKDAVAAYIQELFPLATLLTPNCHEASILSGVDVNDQGSAEEAARKIAAAGAAAVLVKGGDWPSQPDILVDVLYDGAAFSHFRGERCRNRNTHGTGCALSAAICCRLAEGHTLHQAVDLGVQYVRGALQNSYDTGAGAGSLNHLWQH